MYSNIIFCQKIYVNKLMYKVGRYIIIIIIITVNDLIFFLMKNKIPLRLFFAATLPYVNFIHNNYDIILFYKLIIFSSKCITTQFSFCFVNLLSRFIIYLYFVSLFFRLFTVINLQYLYGILAHVYLDVNALSKK